MRDTADDIATVLAAVGALSLVRPPTAGANLFLGPMPEEPGPCVAVLQTGGGSPEAYIGGGKQAYLSVACQIRVRAPREDFQAGQTLAFGIFEALNQTSPSPYVVWTVRESSPFYGGTDGADRHGWSLNVVAEYINTPA